MELNSDTPIRIGVVADTHIPDRVNCLHPDLLNGLRNRRIDYVFHCGDLSHRKVISELSTVAPVFAVRGNRDFFLRDELLMMRVFMINGVRILLTHGHISSTIYWKDKVSNFLNGYQRKRYVDRLSQVDPLAQIYVFGHTHHSENSWVEGKLYFNPGGSSAGTAPDYKTSFGVITITPDGCIQQEIIPLQGVVVKLRRWENGDFSQNEKTEVS